MYYRFVIIIIILQLTSCQPRLKTSITNKQTPLDPTSIVAVLSYNDTFAVQGIHVGAISIGDNGLTGNCGYGDVLKILTFNATSNGANLVKITEHKQPDGFSSCHRVKANLYRVDDPRRFEKEFTWSKWRKLEWTDFKGVPQPEADAQLAAQTTCGFGFQARKAFVSKAKIDAQNTFDCYRSWVRHDHKDQEGLLEHEQKHFDLSEIYARQLREKLSDPDLSIYGFTDQAYTIFHQILSDLQKRQEDYDRETDHGRNKASQQRWNLLIEKELAASESEFR